MTMREFAAWWKKRSAVSLDMNFTGSRLVSVTPVTDPDFRLHITRVDGSETIGQIGDSIDVDRLNWTKIPAPAMHPPDIARIRRFNPWIPINVIEDRITGFFRGSK
jgi:hypothetical protein